MPKRSKAVPKATAQVSFPTARRRSPRQERARITASAIVEAAAELLCELGYARTTTNSIAKRAGVSIGSLYQYFSDKDEIFREILAEHHRQMAPIAQDAVQALKEGREVIVVLEEALAASLAVRRSNPRLMTALHEELAGLASTREGAEGLYVKRRKEGWEMIADALASRQDVVRENLQERAWLVTTVMETVGRSMVHKNMPALQEEALLNLTCQTCARILKSR